MLPVCRHHARDFYAGVLGLKEVAKPEALAGRGGLWFEERALRLHLGVETLFHPARKAHPGFRVRSLGEARERLWAAGCAAQPGEALPGVSRLYTADPFGNRIELLETASA